MFGALGQARVAEDGDAVRVELEDLRIFSPSMCLGSISTANSARLSIMKALRNALAILPMSPAVRILGEPPPQCICATECRPGKSEATPAISLSTALR